MDDRPDVIVVDDEPDILRTVRDLLRRRYSVRTFERGEDALLALESLPDVHAILADQRMPGLCGVEVLRRARTIRPDATRMLMTGYADMNVVVEAVNEGNVFRFLPKPWRSEDLELAVRQAVEQHELVRERDRLLDELRTKNERLRESDQIKDMFIEVASHELNTPVTIILGLSDLWRIVAGPTAGEQERVWLERIHRAGRRLATTIERMFRLVRTEELAKNLDVASHELEPLIRQAAADVEPYLEARGQRITVEIPEPLGPVDVDRVKLGDVLHNLLMNGVKFTPDGGSLTLRGRNVGADRVEIDVVDSGMGIREEEVRHLFRPFFTGYDTMHHSSGEFQYGKRGIGLGLTLVKSYVESHGGSVRFETRPGEGSTFTVNLPRQRAGSG